MKKFIISGTHFGHERLMIQAKRPFATIEEHDASLIGYWNSTVSKNDIVYAIGDFCYQQDGKNLNYYETILNGHIILIYGRNDNINIRGEFRKHDIITIAGQLMYLVHDIDDVGRFKGWIICGSMHQRNMDIFPFINGVTKTINVCAENINFTPLNIDFFKDINLNTIKRMYTISSEIERF